MEASMLKHIVLAAALALTTIPVAEAGSRFGGQSIYGPHYSHGHSLHQKRFRSHRAHRGGRYYEHNRFHGKRNYRRHYQKRGGVVLKFGHGARGGITIYRQPSHRHHR